jgi:hemerythrin
MSLVWRPQMSTGLEWQDKQHQELFRRIDSLYEAMQRHEANTVVKELLKFLGDYARTHFMVEEEYMKTHVCSNCEEHIKCHELFTEHLAEIVELYEKQGASTMVVMRLQSWLRDWLINHIMTIDKKMVAVQSVAANASDQIAS